MSSNARAEDSFSRRHFFQTGKFWSRGCEKHAYVFRYFAFPFMNKVSAKGYITPILHNSWKDSVERSQSMTIKRKKKQFKKKERKQKNTRVIGLLKSVALSWDFKYTYQHIVLFVVVWFFFCNYDVFISVFSRTIDFGQAWIFSSPRNLVPRSC